MASICNDERVCFGGMSGHEGFADTFLVELDVGGLHHGGPAGALLGEELVLFGRGHGDHLGALAGQTLGALGGAAIDAALNAMKVGQAAVRFDPTIVRGLEYYTGAVFEAELLLETTDEKGRPVRFGSIGGGGRYDDLVARFTGETVDTVHGLPGGHIPGARNLFFRDLYNADGTFRSDDELRAAFERAGVDLSRLIVTSCGSGVTASVLLFALHRLGIEDAALYDGSWSEWGADPATPKETGAAA